MKTISTIDTDITSLSSGFSFAEGICSRGHRYFVAETVGLETEGTMLILMVCTACGESRKIEFKICNPGGKFELLRQASK